VETALDPQLPICDAHHHLYPAGSPVHAPYLVDDFERDTATHRVLSTIYVETSGSVTRTDGPAHLWPVGETEWVMTMARDGLMRGIVPFADLLLGAEVADVVDAHAAVAEQRLKGIRYRRGVTGQLTPPPDALCSPAFVAGARVLAHRGLVLELFVYFDALPSVVALAQLCPELSIVLDHLGVPLIVEPWAGRRDEVLRLWRRSMQQLARCPNVSVKLGGIGMRTVTEVDGFGAPAGSAEIAAHWGPEILFVIEQFGAGRCMFESNYPWDDRLCDYVTLWNVYKRIAVSLSATERIALFHGTAVQVFGLGGGAGPASAWNQVAEAGTDLEEGK
jgi:L-fuconolactonase